MRGKISALLASAGTAAIMGLGVTAPIVAAQASVGTSIATAEEAGVQVTGMQTRFVRADVYLRNAAQYSGSVSGLGQSVIVSAGGRWYVLGVSDTTTSSPWSPAVAVFNPSTHTLVCASTLDNCTDQSGGFGSTSYPHGHTVREQVNYNAVSGALKFTVKDITDSMAFTSASYTVNIGAGQSVRMVRIGTEFSSDPWTPPAFTAPAADQKTASFHNVALFNNRGRQVPLVSGYAVTSPLDMTGAGSVTEASPGPISDTGFAVFLRKAS